MEKCECASSVNTIAPVWSIEIEKIGSMGILLKIDDGVYVCINTFYTATLKQFTQQECFYDSHFLTKEKSECCGTIIDNRSYAPICVLEKIIRIIKHTLKNMLRNFFEKKFTVEF